jgi:Zn-dependent M16 (insulinase) family peptidase
MCASYRDPNLKETLNVFDETANYLRKFSANDTMMTNYIIGTIGQMDYPHSPKEKGIIADSYYISGVSQEDIQKERNQVLNTKSCDIVKYADMIEKVMKENNYCVVGSESKIKENKDIFKNVINIK